MDSINKIKTAEKEAGELIVQVEKEVALKMQSEKDLWEHKLSQEKSKYDAKLALFLEKCEKKADSIKIKRRSEIKASVDNIKNISYDKIDNITDWAVKKFITQYK